MCVYVHMMCIYIHMNFYVGVSRLADCGHCQPRLAPVPVARKKPHLIVAVCQPCLAPVQVARKKHTEWLALGRASSCRNTARSDWAWRSLLLNRPTHASMENGDDDDENICLSFSVSCRYMCVVYVCIFLYV
ncbi:Hypothetical predicted protein [Octopus vulgaris]|uniref:Uncharacterized protein n=1 Tax=Octopus vulgaris TaxID=6645 RepID=A0AA36BT88_OCTVU|nr:Hypothetical predicted protein [Octopus vulgaris]